MFYLSIYSRRYCLLNSEFKTRQLNNKFLVWQISSKHGFDWTLVPGFQSGTLQSVYSTVRPARV